MRLPVTAVVGRALGESSWMSFMRMLAQNSMPKQHQRVGAGREQRARVLDVAPQVVGHAVQGLQVGTEQRSHLRRVAIGSPPAEMQ